VPPSTIKRQARLIAAAAKKLLRHLEIYDYRNAAEGPQDLALLDALACAEDGTENYVIRATERVGRLAEIFDGIDATQELERRGRKAADDAANIGRLTTLVGRRGEDAVNAWIAEMMGLYKTLTGNEPRISRVASGPNRGKPSGPFFRFLEAARRPVEFEGKPLRLRAVPERVRAIRARARRKK
jgi:hypothetical protein